MKVPWTRIEDGLPDYDDPKIWLMENGNMIIEALHHDGNPWLLKRDQDESDNDWGGLGSYATHWTDLPEPPEK